MAEVKTESLGEQLFPAAKRSRDAWGGGGGGGTEGDGTSAAAWRADGGTLSPGALLLDVSPR